MRPPLRVLLAAGLAAGCSSTQPPAIAPPGPMAPPGSTAPVAPTTAAATEPPAPDVPAPLPDGRLPSLARPTRYALDLTVDPGATRFTGTVRIEVSIAAATRVLVLHARGLTVVSARAEVGGAAVPAEARSRMAAGGRELPEELVLVFPRALPPGSARLEVVYTGAFDPGLRGLYRTRSGEDWYAFSDFEPTDARRAFPCFDEPGFKVPFELSLTVPQGSVAVANTPEIDRRAGDQHTTVFRFAPTPPLPTYLVAFAVGPLEFLPGPADSPVPLRVVTARGRSALGATAATMAAANLRVLSDYFGIAYPFPKLDLVAVPDFRNGGMENAGLITFRDTALLMDPAHASARARRSVAGITAHELAHQWFGDLVTMAWWNDLWLNEGFATWMAVKVLERTQPAMGAGLDAVSSRAFARRADGLRTARAIRAPVTSSAGAVEAFDAMAYDKGAALLTMLEAWLGEDTFRAGVRAYLTAHAGGNATADDLLAALAGVAPPALAPSVAPVAASFLDHPGVPIVHVGTVCAPGATPQITLRQTRYAPDTQGTQGTQGAQGTQGTQGTQGDASCGPWRVPVCLRYDAAGGPRTTCTVLEGCEATVALPAGRCPRWVHPNPGATGYYWYDLPSAGLRALLADPAALDAAGRLDLLADAGALLESGGMSAEVYLETVGALARSPEPHLLAAVSRVPSEVERTLVDAASRRGFERWVQGLLGPLARSLGWTPAPGDDDARRELRRSVLSTLGFLTEDPWVHREAGRLATRWLADPTSEDADVASVAVPVASRHAGGRRFDELVAALGRVHTPQDRVVVLSALASFDDPVLARRAMELALTDTVRLQDVRALLGHGGHTPARRALALAWIEARYDALRERLANSFRWVLGPVGEQCDLASVAATETALGPRMEATEGSARPFRVEQEFASRCAATRGREAAHAAAFFARRATTPGR